MIAQEYEVSRIIEEESNGEPEPRCENVYEREASMADCANRSVGCEPVNLCTDIQAKKQFADRVSLREQVD